MANSKLEIPTPQNSQIIFIDHQPQMAFGAQSIDRQVLWTGAWATLNFSCRVGEQVLSSVSRAVDDEKGALNGPCAAVRELLQRSESYARNRQYEADDNRARMMIYADLPPQSITYSALTTPPV